MLKGLRLYGNGLKCFCSIYLPLFTTCSAYFNSRFFYVLFKALAFLIPMHIQNSADNKTHATRISRLVLLWCFQNNHNHSFYGYTFNSDRLIYKTNKLFSRHILPQNHIKNKCACTNQSANIDKFLIEIIFSLTIHFIQLYPFQVVSLIIFN